MATRGRKILFGCLFVCTGLVLVAGVAAFAFFVWLNRPGRLLAGERLVDADTVGYASWYLTLDDPGTETFVMQVLDLLQDSSRMQAGSNDFARMVAQFSNRRNEQKFLSLFPMRVTWSARPEGEHLFTAGIAGNANQLRLGDVALRAMIGDDPGADIVQVDYRDEQLFVLSEGGTFFLRAGNAVFASDEADGRRAVDRFVDGEEPPAPDSPFGRLWGRVPRDLPLHGAALNRDDVFGDLLVAWAGEPAAAPPVDPEVLAAADGDLGGIASLTFHGGFAGNGRFELDLTLDCVRPGCDGVDRERLTGVLTRLAEVRLGARVAAHATADGLQLEVRIDDLPDRMRRGWRRMLEGD